MSPPDLDGYDPIGLLGSGGFSDVFLYERRFPRQQVAIKVLVPGALGDRAVERFTAEANLMARLSTHPYIVTVYEAAVSDDGLPYIVMEHYPRPNFLVRSRSERFSVASVLRVGVQVAAALETAHRSGVLHRDVKPPNVLTSEYGRPGLTDFGLAADDPAADRAEGLSIPWSPPEVVAGAGDADERADVYSLGATLWTLLAGGRSPFETDGANKGIDLIDRIERAPVPALDRPDVPASLQRLLAHTMAKEPRARPASAAEVARALQVIEVEQRFDMTPFEVRDDEPIAAPAGPDDAEPTRVRDLTVVEAQPAQPAPPGDGAMIEAPEALRPRAEAAPATPRELIEARPRPAPTAGPDDADDPPPPPVRPARPTVPMEVRPAGPTGASAGTLGPPAQPPDPAVPRRAIVLASIVLGTAVLLSILLGLFFLAGSDNGGDAPDPAAPTSEAAALAAPTNVRVERLADGEYRALWDAPSGMRASDSFELTIDGEPATAPFNRTAFDFTSNRSSPCVVVTAVRDGVPSPPATNRDEC